MSTFDTNVLNTLGVSPANLNTNLSSRSITTFYTAQSVLSASNFVRSTTLSAASTSLLGISPVVPLSSYSIPIYQNLSTAGFETLATSMVTASATDKVVYTTRQFFLTSTGAMHVEFISGGTIDGQAVGGIGFNMLSPLSLSATSVVLSAFSGVKFLVNSAYVGQTMTLFLADRTTYDFTVTAGTQALTASQSSYPELRRLYYLELI